METRNIKRSSLEFIESRDHYPDGANSPTVVTRYKCPCKEGEIVEENTIGFNDHFVTLECEKCEKKYHPFIDMVGDEFVLYKK